MNILEKWNKINTIKYPNISTKVAFVLDQENLRKPMKKKLLAGRRREIFTV